MVATASSDQSIHLYSLEGLRQRGHHRPNIDATIHLGESLPLILVLNGHQKWVWDMSFSADSAYLLTASSDHTCRLWDCLKSGPASSNSSSRSGGQEGLPVEIQDQKILQTGKQGETVRHYVGHDKAVIAIALHDIPA